MPERHLKLLLKAAKGIFGHGVHPRCLRTDDGEFDPRVEEWLRKHRGAGYPIICGVSAGGRRPACWASVPNAIRGAHVIFQAALRI